jgi:hypothetical protein
MTAARTARRKDVRLAPPASAGDGPARLLAPHPWLTASAKPRLDTLFAPPALQSPSQQQAPPTSACPIDVPHDVGLGQIPIEPAAPAAPR